MWYSLSSSEVAHELNTDLKNGLSGKEVLQRRQKYGPNALPEKKKDLLIFKFFSQFKNFLILILIAATFISFITGEYLEAFAILTIVILNATVGFIQETQAEKSLTSLKTMEITMSKVVRDKRLTIIPSEELVPGDIVILESGDKVPADIRIGEAFALKVSEAILTGESEPAEKNAKTIPSGNKSLPDQTNMLFRGTEILYGKTTGIVVLTGISTEIGKIAQVLRTQEEVQTPLKKELNAIGKKLSILILIIAFAILILTTLSELPLIEGVLLSISLAVAAIPEGLPGITTIVLSLGVKRMAEKKALVKKLTAVETLGAVKVIATDKTGTLTENKMNITRIFLANGDNYRIEGQGYEPHGKYIGEKGEIRETSMETGLKKLLVAGILANNSSYDPDTKKIIGDPTEGSLLVAAVRAGIDISETKNHYETIFEVPFSSERKMMSILLRDRKTKEYFLYSKGAPEIILTYSDNNNNLYIKEADDLANQGLRGLALAYKKLSFEDVKKALEKNVIDEKNLTFLGLVGQKDPLRKEIKVSLVQARNAGIKTIMITGDHQATAGNIAVEAGIIKDLREVTTEEKIAHLKEKEIAELITSGRISVFARISPLGKLKIIKSLKKYTKDLIAVTGDGVNDAPALKAADIGIAMGISGTDVTKEVANIILMDDNYATIVKAIREGRVIFSNLTKVVRYLISCNISEIVLISLSIIFQTPLPLLPIQILWINLVTDGIPAIALGLEPPHEGIMEKPPRVTNEGILSKKRWAGIIGEGLMLGLISFLSFLYALGRYDIVTAQTITFSIVAVSQFFHALNSRSEKLSIFSIGVFSNRLLIVAFVLSFALQIAASETSFGNLFFQTGRLNPSLWTLVLALSVTPLIIVETRKILRI